MQTIIARNIDLSGENWALILIFLLYLQTNAAEQENTDEMELLCIMFGLGMMSQIKNNGFFLLQNAVRYSPRTCRITKYRRPNSGTNANIMQG